LPLGSVSGLSEWLTGRLEGLSEVLDEVVAVLQAGRDAQQSGPDPGRGETRLVELRVGGAGGMRDAGFGVAEVHQPRGQLERVEEALARLEAAGQLEVEDRAGAAGEVLLRPLVAGVLRQLRVDDG